MKIDPREVAELACAQHGAPRLDMYAGIHKALRAFMADTLLGLGRLDVDDDLELSQGGERVLQLLDFCRAHLQHENDFVHPAMEARAPGSSSGVASEHAGHESDIDALAASVAQLRACPPAARPAAAQALYRQLALFVAHNFEHMHTEETQHNQVLWAHYSDAELMALHNALVASIPAPDMALVLRWLVPFMAPAERLALLTDMRAHAPAPAFAAALDTVQPHLTGAEWHKLVRDLGMAAAPVH